MTDAFVAANGQAPLVQPVVPPAASPEAPIAPATRLVRRGLLLAVASGKGGVGKTWFALTLAHAMARDGMRVLVVDGDLGLANIDIQLGVMPVQDIGAVAEGRLTVAQAALRLDAGFDVLLGRSGSGALASLPPLAFARLLDALQAATFNYDAVMIDLGAGLDPAVRRLTLEADGLLLVVTDEPTSLTDAYAVLKLYAADHGDLRRARVIVNASASRPAGERTFATLEKACRSFLGQAPSLGGVIRRDDRVRDAIRRQTLLLTRHPTAMAASDVEAIARSFTTR